MMCMILLLKQQLAPRSAIHPVDTPVCGDVPVAVEVDPEVVPVAAELSTFAITATGDRSANFAVISCAAMSTLSGVMTSQVLLTVL